MATWFLRIEGIAGDSTVQGHQGAIEVGSWSWSISNKHGLATGTGSEHAVLHDLVVSAPLGSASLQLIETCALGRQPASASLTGVRQGNQPFTFLRYELVRISVESVSQTAGEDGVVVDQIVLQFRGLKGTFTRQNPDGSAGTPIKIEVGNLPH
jgi:type VI protein secretion system component Hcp